MKRRLTHFRCLSIAAAGLLTFGAPPSQAGGNAGDIVVAVEAPLSGPQKANGQDQLRGVRLAVQQVNRSGGVLGRQVVVVPVDDRANPDRAEAAVIMAVEAGAVAVIGPYNSSVGVLNLPTYLKEKIVPVHMTSSNQTDGEGVTVQPKNDQISPVEVDYVSGTGAKRVAMLVDPSLYTQGMADRLQAALEPQAIDFTTIPITEGKDSYAEEVSAALNSEPDLVYVSTYYPEGSKIAQELNAANTTADCLMGMGNTDLTLVSSAGIPTSQRCVFSGVPDAPHMPGAAARKFVKQYQAEFDTTPGPWGIFTYDSAKILFRAMEEAGTTSFSPVLRKLRRIEDFPGATGEISINRETGNREALPVYILNVNEEGAFVVAP